MPSATPEPRADPNGLSMFALNLRGRVLARAGIDPASLPESGLQVVDARIAGLIATRKVSDQAVGHVAETIQKQFPKYAVLPPADQPPHVTYSPPPPIAAKRRVPNSKTPDPLSASSSSQHGDATKRVSAASRRRREAAEVASEQQRRVIDVRAEAANAHASPGRAAVLKKRMHGNADQEFVQSVRHEQELYADAEAQRVAEKARVREQMRQDMEAHARRIKQREEEERQAREARRLQALQAQEELRLDEQIERDRRRAKFAAEKAAIEQQRQLRRKLKGVEAVRAHLENAKLREATERGIEEDEKLTTQRARETRQALLGFLKESEHMENEKRRLHEIERQKVLDNVAKNKDCILPGGSSLGSSAVSGLQQQLIGQRKMLQNAVMASHEVAEAERRRNAELIEKAAMDAERRTAEQQVERARQDAAKARKMRSELVASLDLELSIHRQRAADEAEDKKYRRKIVDDLAEETRAAQRQEARIARERQATLRTTLQAQVEEKDRSLDVPQQMKISERRGHFLPAKSSTPA